MEEQLHNIRSWKDFPTSFGGVYIVLWELLEKLSNNMNDIGMKPTVDSWELSMDMNAIP